ncbi:MAG: cation transporter [Oscillibacter sp.]|nr:cation transporter [Oscillibacter sp.]
MISLLARLFLKPEGRSEAALRQGYGVLCGAVGIVLNLLLFLVKLLAGLVSGSIAIVADAVNNLSDAASSVVTLAGFLLGGQKPDGHHPFGHGRLEYLSGLAVSVLILLMGLELAKSSLERIVSPPPPAAASGWTVLLLCAAVGVKFYMARYNRHYGKRFRSAAMEAAAADSLGDCAATAAALLPALAGRVTSLPLDGWCGLLVAALIFWSGCKAAKSTIDPLLGTPPSPEFVEQIRSLVLACPAVSGLHDLIVHDYGPGRVMISLHAEVSAEGDLLAIHEEIDRIERTLREELGCEAVIHMDPVITSDGPTEETRRRVEAIIQCIDDGIAIHDFRIVPCGQASNVIFDAVVPFHFRLSDSEVENKIKAAIQALDGSFRAIVNVERSYT